MSVVMLYNEDGNSHQCVLTSAWICVHNILIYNLANYEVETHPLYDSGSWGPELRTPDVLISW